MPYPIPKGSARKHRNLALAPVEVAGRVLTHTAEQAGRAGSGVAHGLVLDGEGHNTTCSGERVGENAKMSRAEVVRDITGEGGIVGADLWGQLTAVAESPLSDLSATRSERVYVYPK